LIRDFVVQSYETIDAESGRLCDVRLEGSEAQVSGSGNGELSCEMRRTSVIMILGAFSSLDADAFRSESDIRQRLAAESRERGGRGEGLLLL
jgi:hypothetical protein